MHRWVTIKPEVSGKYKIAYGQQLASFVIKPSLSSIANGTNDLIKNLLVISPKSTPSIDIVLFSESDMIGEHYLGRLSVKSAEYDNVFGFFVVEYHNLSIPVKSTGAKQGVHGTILVPLSPSIDSDYEKIGDLILKFGVQQV